MLDGLDAVNRFSLVERPMSPRALAAATLQHLLRISTRRSWDGVEPGFEPTVTATTKARDDGLEIRLRDNGTGILPEVRENFQSVLHDKVGRRGNGSWAVAQL